jgi:hypothetical protein
MSSEKRNPAAAIMVAVLAGMARAETDTLRERIKRPGSYGTAALNHPNLRGLPGFADQ